ncbi:hypothetical protein J3458_002036 [Metarhizium acridum]|uniref:uncharacterized protein n=1 Tax=Metarhizium acridum TaxID=92637 RepID=UPI001C6AA734|nr:hypothetical protein J3458_002036 [Metarhizium acridum]
MIPQPSHHRSSKIAWQSVILHLRNSIDAQGTYCNMGVPNCLPRYSVVMQRPAIISISPNSPDAANSSSAPSKFVACAQLCHIVGQERSRALAEKAEAISCLITVL